MPVGGQGRRSWAAVYPSGTRANWRRWGALGRSGSSAPVGRDPAPTALPPLETGRCWFGRRSPASARAPRCWRTAASSIPSWPSTRRSARSAARSAIRSATATAASASSRRADPRSTEGALVFAFHPHQDAFVANAADVVALGLGRSAAARRCSRSSRRRCRSPSMPDRCSARRSSCSASVSSALLTALMLRRAGARVVAVEPQAWRRDAAVGARRRSGRTRRICLIALGADGRRAGVPLVIEVSGNPDALRTALGLLSHEGTVLVASWYGTKEVSLPLGRRVPPSPADDPQHPGVDDPRPAE